MADKTEIIIKECQIWEVITQGFLTSGEKCDYKRPVKLNRGEMIEIRYAYKWHFRTEDNIYFHAKPQMILDNCRLHGVIWGNVHFGNQANLEEIMRLSLFDAENGIQRINTTCFYCKEQYQQKEKYYRGNTWTIFSNCGCKDKGA